MRPASQASFFDVVGNSVIPRFCSCLQLGGRYSFDAFLNARVSFHPAPLDFRAKSRSYLGHSCQTKWSSHVEGPEISVQTQVSHGASSHFQTKLGSRVEHPQTRLQVEVSPGVF